MCISMARRDVCSQLAAANRSRGGCRGKLSDWNNRTPDRGSIPGCLVMTPAQVALELGTLDMARLVGLGEALTSLQTSATGGERLTRS